MKKFEGILATPPLWKTEQFGIPQFELPNIDTSSFIPEPIPKNLRLGHQVEHIVKQLLDHDPTYQVLAHNLQLKRGNITIGELDFILREIATNRLHHVELTYKFYILDPTISEPVHRAMGPNRKDMFFAKMVKTRDRQFPLLHSPEAIELLSTLDISEEIIKQSCCFLGQLFAPYGQYVNVTPLNKECISGYWLTLKALSSAEFNNHTFYIPQKAEWIHLPHANVVWQSQQEVLLVIKLKHMDQRAPMVWVRTDNKILNKCFVVWW